MIRIFSRVLRGAACLLASVAWCAAASVETAARPSGQLRVATCQFPVSGDVRANGEWIRRQLREARQRDAELVHFPECALSGYPDTDFKARDGFCRAASVTLARS